MYSVIGSRILAIIRGRIDQLSKEDKTYSRLGRFVQQTQRTHEQFSGDETQSIL